jgi:hypothetical protein
MPLLCVSFCSRVRLYFKKVASGSFHEKNRQFVVHVQGQNGEAKFWLEPTIKLAQHIGLAPRETNEALRLVQEHQDDIRSAWHKHFPG